MAKLLTFMVIIFRWHLSMELFMVPMGRLSISEGDFQDVNK